MQIRIVAAFLLFAVPCLAAAPPNVVLILADDQGWTGTSVAMDPRIPASRSEYYRTPALERLAREGMRFSNAYAPHPNCSPTRMSIQTGMTPVRLGATDIVDVVPGSPAFIKPFYERYFQNKPLLVHLPILDLPDSAVTIAEFLKQHRPSYVTAHFGKWHMNGGSPSRHGYDEHTGVTSNPEGRDGPPNPKRTPSVTKRATDFLDVQAAAGQPFYLQVSYYAVHTPTLAMPETVAAYEARPRGQHHQNATYAAMTEELDNGVAAILAKLDEHKLSGDTYVIYTSDNGGETMRGVSSNLPLAESKTYVWEGGVRVPLLIRGPGIEPGAVSHVPAIGYDLFPTIAAWLGIDAALPANQDGGSLAPVLANRGRGHVDRPTEPFVWYYPHYRNMKGVFPQAAIRLGDFKLIRELETGRTYLFNLAIDLGETNNLASAEPGRVRQLAATLDAYLDSVSAKRPTRNSDYDPAKDLGLEPESSRRP